MDEGGACVFFAEEFVDPLAAKGSIIEEAELDKTIDEGRQKRFGDLFGGEE